MATAEAAVLDQSSGRGKLLSEHGAALARVCMALLGDAKEVERVLEQVAGDLAAKREEPTKATLFGLARAACAVQLSKIPLRSRHGGAEAPDAPKTERMGAADAIPARALLAKLKPTEREALVLHAVGGLTVDEVAEACGTDVAAARSRIAQGMSRLVAEGSGR